MADQDEVTVGTYYVRAGAEAEFEAVLPRSWATLRRLGFVADERPTLYRSVATPTRYLELVRWLPGVMGPAHEHPDVIPIWSRLGELVEAHDPAPADRGLVFDEFVPVTLDERA
jgi:hypothetical protein